MDYMELDALCLKKADKLNHSLTQEWEGWLTPMGCKEWESIGCVAYCDLKLWTPHHLKIEFSRSNMLYKAVVDTAGISDVVF